VPLVEFAINSTISNASGFAPFKLNCSYVPSLNLGAQPEHSSVPRVKHFVNKVLQNLSEAHNAIIESRVHQMHHANRCCAQNDTFANGELVYVSTSDLSLPKGRASKLIPKYIGPFKVLDAHPEVSTYVIALPKQLRVCRLHNCFHWSKLCTHFTNDDTLFPQWEHYPYYDFGTPDDQEWSVDEILAHKWDKNKLSFQIRWNLGDSTWEPLQSCKDLQALDAYLELMGIKDPCALLRCNLEH
jgi:hypothetical protein